MFKVVVDRYIAKADISADIWQFFKYRHRPISFSVWPMRSRRDFYLDGTMDFYFDGVENGSAWAQCSHSPSCSLSSLTVLCNMDRSLSNNQIELLNKGIKRYTKKYYNDCFYIISNRKANFIILSRLPSAFSKCAFISFKQIFEWLMNI